MDSINANAVLNTQCRSLCGTDVAYSPPPWSELLAMSCDSDVERRTEESADFDIEETEEVLFALALTVEQRDHQTAGHCERLAFLSVALGVSLTLSRKKLLALYRGGYLHDVGKVGIPDSILFKPGSLTAEEWVTMRSHTTRGEEICRPMKSLATVLPIIRHHHERWDGSGYPDGLRGEQIPLLARILQIVDIYDALTSPRPYKAAYTPAKALEMIQNETARGWRDPVVVERFFQLHRCVLSKMPAYELGDMQPSLAHLRHFLATDFAYQAAG